MQQPLSVRVADLQTLADRWSGTAAEPHETVAPVVPGFSFQASAAAVNAAHADVRAFTAGLVGRVSFRATNAAEANTRYRANEADSANRLAAVAFPVTSR
jgi:hypothetical protein